MADRIIYRLWEYDSATGNEKIWYSNVRKNLENQFPTISEDQHITEINFDANDMQGLCDQLNSDELEGK
jgi:hypothetical protein